ncbi:MAG: Hsp70 family protein, partial [Chloroflexota bacterium]
IPPAPRGLPQVEVTFDIDANGILNVRARDKATGREQHVTITASSGLNKNEVERLVREAQEHAEEDRRKRERIELRNESDTLAYQTEKVLRDNADKVPADVKSDVEAKISALREALTGEDDERIRSALEELRRSATRIGEAMYQAQPPPGAPPEEPAGATAGKSDGERKDQDTIEGEFTEKPS